MRLLLQLARLYTHFRICFESSLWCIEHWQGIVNKSLWNHVQIQELFGGRVETILKMPFSRQSMPNFDHIFWDIFRPTAKADFVWFDSWIFRIFSSLFAHRRLNPHRADHSHRITITKQRITWQKPLKPWPEQHYVQRAHDPPHSKQMASTWKLFRKFNFIKVRLNAKENRRKKHTHTHIERY